MRNIKEAINPELSCLTCKYFDNNSNFVWDCNHGNISISIVKLVNPTVHVCEVHEDRRLENNGKL